MSAMKRHLEELMDALEGGKYLIALDLLRELEEDQKAQWLLTAVECLAELEEVN